MKRLILFAGVLLLIALPLSSAGAATTVPGHTGKDRIDSDENGYPDEGVVVTGHYYSVYAEDAGGDWYWDLGDGRVQGTVGSIDELDQETLTTCDYVVNYRGTFENDPFMDSGSIMNNIRCHGYESAVFHYEIVHESDPRYRGNPEWSIWGTWEYHELTESSTGNLVRPITGVG
ncbi:MAG TPA: hypothetical protein VFZ41_04970 [Solirubrobacterales bacterium]